MLPYVFIKVGEFRPEYRRNGALCAASRHFHLKQAILRDGISVAEIESVDIVGVDVWNAEIIPDQPDTMQFR